MNTDNIFLNKKRNRPTNDNEPLNENGYEEIGIAKGSINQEGFGTAVHKKDIAVRDSKELIDKKAQILNILGSDAYLDNKYADFILKNEHLMSDSIITNLEFALTSKKTITKTKIEQIEKAAKKISSEKGQHLEEKTEEKIKENENTPFKLLNPGARTPTLFEIKNALLKPLGKITSYPTKFRGEIRDKIKNIASNINLLDEKSITGLYKQFIETKGEKTEENKKARENAITEAAAIVDRQLQ